MRPAWFLETEIPYSQMWPDDIHWLPLVLEGNKILGRLETIIINLLFNILLVNRFDYSDEDTIDDFTVRIQ